MAKNDKKAFADALSAWPPKVAAAGVRKEGGKGARYHPIARNNSILRTLDDPEATYQTAREILDGPNWDDPDTGSGGWNRIMDQAGPDYLWEWLIMDRTAPWADLFTAEHRWKVAVAVAHTLKREIR